LTVAFSDLVSDMDTVLFDDFGESVVVEHDGQAQTVLAVFDRDLDSLPVGGFPTDEGEVQITVAPNPLFVAGAEVKARNIRYRVIAPPADTEDGVIAVRLREYAP
jgi:hypothetical protein